MSATARRSALPGRWMRVLVGGALAITVLVLVLLVATWVREPVLSEPPSDRPASDLFRMTGIHFEIMDGPRPVFLIEADEITHRRRKVGPLTLNPVKELAMSGVRVELRPVPGDDEPLDRRGRKLLLQFLAERELGMVTRIRIENLSVSVLRDGARTSGLDAGVVDVDVVRGTARFEKRFSLTTPAGQTLITRDAAWDRESGRLWIPGSFLIVGEERQRAREAWVRIGQGGELLAEEGPRADSR